MKQFIERQLTQELVDEEYNICYNEEKEVKENGTSVYREDCMRGLIVLLFCLILNLHNLYKSYIALKNESAGYEVGK